MNGPAMTDEREAVQAILDRNVGPYLQSHGGSFEIVSLNDGILQIRLHGACSVCPAAWVTTEYVIAEQLRREMPQIHQVTLAPHTSPELLADAKLLMHRAHAKQARRTREEGVSCGVGDTLSSKKSNG